MKKNQTNLQLNCDLSVYLTAGGIQGKANGFLPSIAFETEFEYFFRIHVKKVQNRDFDRKSALFKSSFDFFIVKIK